MALHVNSFSPVLQSSATALESSSNHLNAEVPDETPDDLLVDLAMQGGVDAFAQLVSRHNRHCLAAAYSILRNRGDAEDEVQNGWMQAWTHLSTYQHQGAFSAWVGRIVTNQCLMRLRKARNERPTSTDEVFDADGTFRLEVIDQREIPEEIVGDHEVSRVILTEIAGLPPLLRRVLVLRDVQDQMVRDIAKYLEITIPAAKSRLQRARLELRKRMAKHLGNFGAGSLVQKFRRQRAAYVRAV
jgi:RNA polymerase sigma-70 factor, ECF subfamily